MTKSSTVSLTVNPSPPPAKITTGLTIGLSATTITVGGSVRISGQLTAAKIAAYSDLAGKPINIYANGALIATVYTHNGAVVTKVGYYEFDWVPPSAGSYSIYAEFLGDADYAGCAEEAGFEW